MTLELILRPVAEAELDGAVEWYNSEREGVGDQFFDAVRQQFQSMTQAPKRYPSVHRNIRMALVPPYPYAIYFYERRDSIIVISVFHASRDPAEWKSRQ